MQNYCRLYKDDGSYVLTSMTFGRALDLLMPYGFFQCHKSYALNLSKVLRYLKEGKAEIVGEVFVPVARRRRNKFLEVMGSTG